MAQRTTIWTVGHGNRSLEAFLEILKEAGVECLVDVRAYPASRRHPQFGRDALLESLAAAGIRYLWEGKALGGRRKPAGSSPHVALRDPGFRAYADHMATPEFQAGRERLVAAARAQRTAFMCAERLPSECHRSLISDGLTVHSMRVVHLIDDGAAEEHRLSSLARLRGDRLIYDAGAQRSMEF